MEPYQNPHPPGCFWHATAEKHGAPNIKWCEETLCQIVSEPANSWSNLGFVIAALVIFWMARKKQSASVKWIPWAFLLMGLGSFYYHVSNFYISQVLDFLGMFLLIHWFLTINLLRIKLFQFKGALVFYFFFMILNTLVMHGMYLYNIKFQLLVALAGLLVLFSEFAARRKNGKPGRQAYLIGALAFIIGGEIFSLLDLSGVLCDPSNHFFQGHALWHVLSAMGLLLAYKYFEQFDEELP